MMIWGWASGSFVFFRPDPVLPIVELCFLREGRPGCFGPVPVLDAVLASDLACAPWRAWGFARASA